MQILKWLFFSRARSAMKSIIFDLSVSRQHGELLQGPQAADMFLSAKKFHIVFESVEIYRRASTLVFVQLAPSYGGVTRTLSLSTYTCRLLYIY